MDAMNSGVHGYLPKDNAIEELLQCIEAVLVDKPFVSPQFEGSAEKKTTTTAKSSNGKYPAHTHWKSGVKIDQWRSNQCRNCRLTFVSPNTIDNHQLQHHKKT